MLEKIDRVFNNLYGTKGVSFEVAKSLGDFSNLKETLEKGADYIINEVKNSQLKGRGGAGFPTGMKWSFINKKDPRPKYLVINGDEGEPGTCKDREIIRHEPYKIVEGAIITSYAIEAKTCYIYIRGEFIQETRNLQKAIDEAYANGLLGKNCLGMYDLDIYIHFGAGAYICGEETALLESLEGRKGFPRIKPPFPAVSGLYANPTVINNIETIAVVPTILRRGADWYKSMGVAEAAGTKLFCISGFVNNPCVVEERLGISFKELIETHCGGVIGGWDNLLAVIPGGSSTPIIPAHLCERLTMDFEGMKAVGSSLGTGAVIVFNKSVEILKAMKNIVSFYNHESCGQCTPCREGSAAAVKIMNNIINKEAKPSDVDLLERIMDDTFGTTICALNDATVFAVRGFLKHYKEDIKQSLQI
ncbi:MAG: NADH-quinone oxidoreductase subunit NuoF [Alphaproteobacteria bacterium]|jgi:NADH-quinone oxidoreductase subunit F|nr:NADH-quinone oxidoreductase subunit NuoF [Alphaproteobacteria bacterium]